MALFSGAAPKVLVEQIKRTFHTTEEHINLFYRRCDYGYGILHSHDEELRTTVMLEF